jgi:hypothetical protein
LPQVFDFFGLFVEVIAHFGAVFFQVFDKIDLVAQFAGEPLDGVAHAFGAQAGFELALADFGGAAQFAVPHPPERKTAVVGEDDVDIVLERQLHGVGAERPRGGHDDGNDLLGGEMAFVVAAAFAGQAHFEHGVLDVEVITVGIQIQLHAARVLAAM